MIKRYKLLLTAILFILSGFLIVAGSGSLLRKGIVSGNERLSNK